MNNFIGIGRAVRDPDLRYIPSGTAVAKFTLAIDRQLSKEKKQEAGEAIDILKKYYYQGHELDKDKLFDEAGDILWYIAELMTGLGKTMDDLARHNIGKLVKRYPEGFEKEKSIYREVEEKIVSE